MQKQKKIEDVTNLYEFIKKIIEKNQFEIKYKI